MPLYDYSCRAGHTTEQRGNYDTVVIRCPVCRRNAYRHAAYEEQYTRTESGGRSGRLGSSVKLTEGQERNARHSDTILKETGAKSGIGLR